MKLWMVSAIHNCDYRHRCLPYFDMNLRFLLPPELLYRHNNHCISRIFYRKKVVPTSLLPYQIISTFVTNKTTKDYENTYYRSKTYKELIGKIERIPVNLCKE